MRCSVGVLELPAGVHARDADRLATAIATLKADARKSESGICLRLLETE